MENEKKHLKIGIVLMLTSAMMTCSGQLCWKLGAERIQYVITYYLVGFILYGIGALLMVIAFKFGEMSILHPMLSVGFIGSLFLGKYFLKEEILVKKIVGILLILIGVCLLSQQGHSRQVERR